jgi:putative ABC transport system permease protein
MGLMWWLPPWDSQAVRFTIFLLVSAFLVNMTLSRLIALEREQIGLLKAMGYSSWSVVRHYAGFVSLIALIGIAIGMGAGTWLGVGMTKLYAQFFSFPFLVFSRNPAVYGIAAAATYAAALAGAVKAVSDVAWLSPAVAMSPPAPQRYRKIFGGGTDLSRFVRQSGVIVMRHLTHWPMRTGSGILGMALAVAILEARSGPSARSTTWWTSPSAAATGRMPPSPSPR